VRPCQLVFTASLADYLAAETAIVTRILAIVVGLPFPAGIPVGSGASIGAVALFLVLGTVKCSIRRLPVGGVSTLGW